MTAPVIAAVDTGGTFTDVVVLHGGELHVLKVPSTPDDPARAVIAGLRAALGDTRADLLIHGSTVATNALLERTGARVVLVTNRGFEDVLLIGRQNRPQLYALTGTRAPPLVADDARIGVAGRLDHTGAELASLDADELHALVARVRALGADSVAICTLHSYANAAHERALAAALAPLALPMSVSSELLPEYREYERMSTTVVNAYVAPLMNQYLGAIERDAHARTVRIMGSGGGALAVARARRDAAHTVLSGPAGGVAGALHIARRHGIADIMTFDMGGTSTDVSLCPGTALHTRELTVAGMPVALPVLDIHTVGAGGGSIARVDAGGALRVGPVSAGAVPGPICYARGGTELTVTDANVALGRLFPHTTQLRLDAAAVAAPLAALADALGCAGLAAAEGIVAVVNAAMEGALRVISVERGYDPVDFTLVPFGGAAGLHAVALAQRLGMTRLLVPPAPGVLSAFGMLVAPVRRDATRTVMTAAAGDTMLEPVFAELETSALHAMLEDGVARAAVTLHRSIAARYRGQSFELDVPAADWRTAFHDAHERRFGYARRAAALEAVTLRVEALAPTPAVPAPQLARASAPPPLLGTGPVYCAGALITAARYEREALRAGHLIRGPAVIIEQTAAFWLPDGWLARAAGDGSLIVQPDDSVPLATVADALE
ncbi:MAG TPA: hydantoinase/oxoprolinase family protein [Longimicrobiales bacterium]|nr:hydantoinase/oxoprolinase family protein [Longimicrobiales bacterium]